MPPHSSSMLGPEEPLSEKITANIRREDGFQEKPTSLVEVVNHLPKDVFEKRPFRAYMAALQAIILTAASSYVLYHTESYFGILIGWFAVGTCATGMFVIGHECAHGSFGKSAVEEEIVGTIMMSPLSWPYHGWLNSHNHHHSYTNLIGKDHLWTPLFPAFIDKCSKPVLFIMEKLLVGPLFFESSIAHHIFHFNIFMFPKRVQPSVARSVAFTISTCFAMWYQLYAMGGIFLIFKMWFMPYLAFNFWLSTYTYFHHKSLDIPWLEQDKWNKAQAQLFHTAHVDYHPIFEWLHFDINWHIPHHVSVKIPWYNLRRATYALIKVYGKNIRQYEMSWTYWKEVTSSCHVHDEEKNYISVKEYESRKNKSE